MSHPLEAVINNETPFLLIGQSKAGRFPALSFHAYTTKNRQFYCFDMDGETTSRGPSAGKKVYTELTELPEDLGDLAIIWVKPKAAKEAVELAKEAGSKRIWFSFKTGHHEAVDLAMKLGMEVVEIGRCPVYYLEGSLPMTCRLHRAAVSISGARRLPPQLDPHAPRKELY